MGISLVGPGNTFYTVYDPKPILKYCQSHGVPTDWYGKANRFMTSLGEQPGRAWGIMAYQDPNNLFTATQTDDPANGTGLDDLFDLQFDDLGGGAGTNTQSGGAITIANLVFVNADALTSGNLQDPLAMYLVELADIRWLAANPFFSIAANSQYNVRAPSAAQTYYDGSM